MASSRPRRKCARYTPDEPPSKRITRSAGILASDLTEPQKDMIRDLYADYRLGMGLERHLVYKTISVLELYPEQLPESHLLISGEHFYDAEFPPMYAGFTRPVMSITLLSIDDAEKYQKMLPRRVLSLALDDMRLTPDLCKRIKRLGIKTEELRFGDDFSTDKSMEQYGGLDQICKGVTRLHWMCSPLEDPPNSWVAPPNRLEFLQMRFRGYIVAEMPVNSRVVDIRVSSATTMLTSCEVVAMARTLDNVEEIWITCRSLSGSTWAKCGYTPTSINCPLVRVFLDNHPHLLSSNNGPDSYHHCFLHRRIRAVADHRMQCIPPEGSNRIPIQLEFSPGFVTQLHPPIKECPNYPAMLKEFTDLLTEILPDTFELGLIPEIISWCGLPPEPLLPNGESTFLLS